MNAVTLEPNPLVEGLERLPVPHTTLTIFGATGDLSRRKLLPAIYNLAHEGALPERFNLIGVSRSEMTDDEYREMARASIEKHSRRDADGQVLDVDGQPIAGLYAAGNASASMTGAFYPGPGIPIGTAMVFSALAVRDLAS